MPFIIGTTIAIIVQKPAVKISEKFKIHRGTASLILVLLIYAALLVAVYFIINKLYGVAVSFYDKIPEFLDKITLSISKIAEDFEGFSVNLSEDVIENISVKITELVSTFLKNFITDLPGIILSIFAAVITGCYIAKDIDSLKKNIDFALRPKYIENLKLIWKITKDKVFRLLKGYVILSLISFILLTIGLYCLKFSSALKAALIISIVDFLPILGSGTVLIPWAVISFIKGNMVFATGLVIIYVVLIIARNIAEPKIIGKQVGIHPLITLISMFLGLKIFGFSGLFILPLIVTVTYHFISHKVTEEKRQHSM